MNTVSMSMAAAPDPNFRPVILAVDDEEAVRLPLKYLLKEQYPDVVLCSNASEALNVIKSRTIHVAILDIKMVGESGLDLLGTIKAHDPFIECLMLTAFETQSHIKEALRLGACDFLQKPPQIQTVLDAVGKAVQRRRTSEKMKAAIARATSLESELFLMQCGVIHDIRNQMTVVSGMLGLMEYRMQGKTMMARQDITAMQTELLTASRTAEMCMQISSRQLELIRTASNAPEDEMAAIDRIANDISSSLMFHPEARNTTFAIERDEHLPLCNLPPTTAFQLLLNLALNAAQARKPSDHRPTVTITLRVRNTPLSAEDMKDSITERYIGVQEFGNRAPFVALTVTDHGTGMKPDTVSKLFAHSFTTKSNGTGVGLPFVAKMCKDHRLLLHLKSIVGTGTTVTIYLPALPAGATA